MNEADPPAKSRSDLGVRTASALVMAVLAISALWIGGDWLDIFAALVSLVAFYELALLILKATPKLHFRLAALAAGALYVASALWALIVSRDGDIFLFVTAVIAVDTFAYFAGRKFGGPKIAPSISPSKTWSGFLGGVFGASLFWLLKSYFFASPLCDWYFSIVSPTPLHRFGLDGPCSFSPPDVLAMLAYALMFGLFVAVVAQSGDFLESWIKRRAGEKDSSKLIPGHGGLLDRIDGHLAVFFVLGCFGLFEPWLSPL